MTAKTIKNVKKTFYNGFLACLATLFFWIAKNITWLVTRYSGDSADSSWVYLLFDIACVFFGTIAKVFMLIASVYWFYKMLEDFDYDGNPFDHIETNKNEVHF